MRSDLAVLFDLDSTLVDSKMAVRTSWLQLADEAGFDPRAMRGMHGVPAEGCLRLLLPEADEATIQHWTKRIEDIEVAMDGHPHPECPNVIPPMEALIGERLGKGWRKTIQTHLGGIAGCTHLRELLNSLATAAFQAIPGALFDPDENKPPLYLGTCKSWDFNGPVVMRVYPQFYRWQDKDKKS